MGFVPPPPPATTEQLAERHAAGARTFAELDPALEQWRVSQVRMRRFMFACLVVSAVVMLVGLVVMLVANPWWR